MNVALHLFAGSVAAAALSAAVADKPPPVVRDTGEYAVTFDKGVVRKVEIRPRAGGRIIVDHFVDDPDRTRIESRAFADSGCDSAACRATCFYARNTRPFRRLTRLDARGRKLWSWSAPHWSDTGQSSAYEFMCSAEADALSPDGRYLAVDIFAGFGGVYAEEMGPGVLRLARPPDEASAKGLGSKKDDFIGWKPGAPATLIAEQDAGVVHDGPPEYVETRFDK